MFDKEADPLTRDVAISRTHCLHTGPKLSGVDIAVMLLKHIFSVRIHLHYRRRGNYTVIEETKLPRRQARSERADLDLQTP